MFKYRNAIAYIKSTLALQAPPLLRTLRLEQIEGIDERNKAIFLVIRVKLTGLAYATMAGHIFQARPVWIYTQSNIINI
jgi:hypothetical protein